MGASGNLVTIAGIVGVIVGGIVLLTSSLFINDYTDAKPEDCDRPRNQPLCKLVDFYLIAGSLGIIAGLIQIGSYFFAWKKQLIPFAVASCVVSLLCLVAMALAVDQNILDAVSGTPVGDRALAFTAFLIIDMIVALAIAIGMFLQSRKQ